MGADSFTIWAAASDFRLALTGLFNISPNINFGFHLELRFLLRRQADFAEFDFHATVVVEKDDFHRIAMAVGDTSYLASAIQHNPAEDYKDNSYPHKCHEIYNSVGPKHCIADHLNWLFANYSSSVVSPAFCPNSTANFRFCVDPTPSTFLNKCHLQLPIAPRP